MQRFKNPVDALSTEDFEEYKARQEPALFAALTEEPAGWRLTLRRSDRRFGRTTVLRTSDPIRAMRSVERVFGRELRWEEAGSALIVRDWRPVEVAA